MMTFRSALPGEEKVCFQIIEEARAYQYSMGFVQWQPGYLTLDTVVKDIESGIGYVFAEDNKLLGYCCIIFGEEPAYHNIEGAWKTERPYAVIHRLAFGADARGRGLSGPVFSCIKDLCKEKGIDAIRADTQEENKVMQHIFDKQGFVYCGTVIFNGGPKLAYEWDRC